MPENTHDQSANPTATRRGVLRAAGWTAPAFTLAAASPAWAVSTPVTSPYTAPAPTSTSGAAGVTSSFTVPAGVTSLSYVVAGGGGGGTGEGLHLGGSGARISGVLSVTPGTVLLLSVAQGGISLDRRTNGFQAGGQGFANGGDADTRTPDAYLLLCGSGGGASAISLADGSPVVVAAGGGGTGNYTWSMDAMAYPYNSPGIGRAGSADGDGTAGGATSTPHAVRAPGGIAGKSGVAGAGGSAPTITSPSARSITAEGNPGADRANGGHGGTSARVFVEPDMPGRTADLFVSGAGGGGYVGGGSGAAVWASFTGPNGFMVGTGGGAGGQSWTSPAPVGTVVPHSATRSLAGNRGAAADVRMPGSIVLTWF